MQHSRDSGAFISPRNKESGETTDKACGFCGGMRTALRYTDRLRKHCKNEAYQKTAQETPRPETE